MFVLLFAGVNLVNAAIGELNCLNQTYQWQVMNTTQTGNTSGIAYSKQQFNLNMSWYNWTGVQEIDYFEAYFNWNGTDYAATKKSNSTSGDLLWQMFEYNISSISSFPTSDTNISYFWRIRPYPNCFGDCFEGNLTENIYNNLTARNFQLFHLAFDDCTNLTTKTLNFTFYNYSLQTTAIQTNNSYRFEFTTFAINYTGSRYNTSNLSFCIYPAFANTSIFKYTIIYNCLGCAPGSSIIEGLNINNVSQNISLFVIDDWLIKNITITVYDSFFNVLPNYVVEGYKFEPLTNNFTLIDSEETDENGQVIMSLISGDFEYKFLVKTGGVIKYESSVMKLFSNSYTFILPPEGQAGIPEEAVGKIAHSLTYNITTRNVTLTWNDLSNIATLYYLDVSNVSLNQTQLLSSQWSAVSADTLVYTIPNQSGFYLANFYVIYSGDGERYFVDSISIDDREEYQVFGAETLIYAMLWIGTLMFIGIMISAEAAIILSLVGMIGMYLLGFINLGNSVVGLIGIVITGIILLVKAMRQ